jgi:3-oxoacyl-[acyl-carrier-protein] synthase II
VVVTGLGPVSAIGSGRNEFWDALVAGRHGFGPITVCDAARSASKVAAEVKDFHLGRYVAHGEAFGRHTPRPVQLALAAAVLALHDAEIDLDACDADRLGVHVGTSVGNIGDAFRTMENFERTGAAPAHTAFHLFSGSAACVLSGFFNLRGSMNTTSQGCNSGLDALGGAMRTLQSGAADAILVVGTDCELVPEVLLTLNASKSLSTRWNDEPGRASRPFDLGRDGNVVGEGAAALLLETEEHAVARGARIYARLGAHAICSAGQNRQYSHDAPDLDTRPCVRAFRAAIDEAGWLPEHVGLVSANGSSSVLYDRLEALALKETFGERFPEVPVHSTKSMLGQHGAGSSALQAVAACLTIRRGTIPPTINHEQPDPACGPLRVVTKAEAATPSRVLVHSIGLGGFYYSVGAFEAWTSAADPMHSGIHQVHWNEPGRSRFRPAEEFTQPLTPWKPRGPAAT